MRNKLMTNMKSITEEMGDEFPQLNKEMSALGAGNNASGAPPVGNTKTPTKGLAGSSAQASQSGGGPESVEKRTSKEKFISKLPNLKDKLHKKDKHVVLSDHVVDDGGSEGPHVPPADGQPSSQPPSSAKPGHSHRLSIEHTKEELVLLLPGKKRSKGNRGEDKSDKESRKDKKDGDEGKKGDKKDGGKEGNSAQKPKQSKSEAVVAKIRNKTEKRDKKEAHANSSSGNAHDDHLALIPPTSSGDQAVTSDNNGQPNNDPASGSAGSADTVEKVQELVKTKRLPQETITIHSPESGTTIF